MRYVSVDIETNGLNLMADGARVLSLAAVVDDFNEDDDFYQRPEYQFNAIFTDGVVPDIDPVAYDMNKDLVAWIDDRHVSRKNASCFAARLEGSDLPDGFETGAVVGASSLVLHEFVQFLAFCGVKLPATVAGKNVAGFDIPFLKRQFLVSGHSIDGLFHHRSLDPAPLYFDPSIDDALPNLKKCLERVGINKEVEHKALADAIDVVRVLRNYYVE